MYTKRLGLKEAVQVESRVRDVFDGEAHLAQTSDSVVTLVLFTVRFFLSHCVYGCTNSEVALEMDHLVLNRGWLKHGDSSLLESVHSTAIQVATT